MTRRSFAQSRSGGEGSEPFEVTSNVSMPVQLGNTITLSCNANKALSLCIFKPPFAKKAKIFTPTTQLEGGRIRMSEQSGGDPKMCEIVVDKVESKDLGKWRCVVRCKCNNLKGKHFDVSETPGVQETPENAPENSAPENGAPENSPENAAPEPEPELFMQIRNG